MASVFGWLISGLGVVTSLFWLGQLLAIIKHRMNVHWLADLPDTRPGLDWPGLAVIFAARDEEAGVERTTRSILSQDYPALSIIAVDDRSVDATGVILEKVADDDPRLRVIHVHELLPGWLGKTHALQIAASTETSPWLLFTDADVYFAPGTLRRAIAWAEEEAADHVTVVPEFVTEGVGERLFMMMMTVIFAARVLGGRVEPPGKQGAHLGIGAFNLVREKAFRGIGGFERLALSVDDDNRLAEALKAAGYRGRAILGVGAVSVRWQSGLGGLIRGMEKNFFALVDFRVGVVVLASLGCLVLGVAPYAGLFVGPWWTRAFCLIGIGAIAGILNSIRRQTGIAWYYALVFPIGVSLYLFAWLRSTWLTLQRQGVRWRDCHYPLSELREHVGRRNAWLQEIR